MRTENSEQVVGNVVLAGGAAAAQVAPQHLRGVRRLRAAADLPNAGEVDLLGGANLRSVADLQSAPSARSAEEARVAGEFTPQRAPQKRYNHLRVVNLEQRRMQAPALIVRPDAPDSRLRKQKNVPANLRRSETSLQVQLAAAAARESKTNVRSALNAAGRVKEKAARRAACNISRIGQVQRGAAAGSYGSAIGNKVFASSAAPAIFDLFILKMLFALLCIAGAFFTFGLGVSLVSTFDAVTAVGGDVVIAQLSDGITYW